MRSLRPQCLISFKEGATGEEDFITPEHFLLPTPMNWDTKERQDRWQIRLERWERQCRRGWETFFKHKPAEINTVMQECFNRDGTGRAGGSQSALPGCETITWPGAPPLTHAKTLNGSFAGFVPTPEEKAELFRWGAGFDHNIDGVMEVVKLGTCSPGRASTSFAV